MSYFETESIEDCVLIMAVIKGLGLFGHFMLDISSLKYLHDM